MTRRCGSRFMIRRTLLLKSLKKLLRRVMAIWKRKFQRLFSDGLIAYNRIMLFF